MVSLLFSLLRGVRQHLLSRHLQTLLLFASLLLYSATGYMYFEQQANPDLSWLDSFWWAMVTMTTVGYGDYFPSTMGGRVLVGFPTMLLGVGVLGYVLSLLATAMIESKLREAKGMNQMVLNDHVLICGFIALEKTLKLIGEIRKDAKTEDASIVLVDDELDELPVELRENEVHFVKGDPAREAVLHKAGIDTALAVIAQADPRSPNDSDHRNLKLILTIQGIAPAVPTVAECVNPENEVYFRRAHCDSVVCIASLTEQMLVQELQDPGVAQVVSELTSNAHGRQIYIIDPSEDRLDYGSLRADYGNGDIVLLGIRRDNDNHILPDDGFDIRSGDKLILIASKRPA